MSKQTEQIQRILKATEKSTLEDAAQIVEKGLAVAARQDYVLSHMGAISIVYSPAGMMSFTVPPEAGLSLDHLSLIEAAVLEFQQALIARRQELVRQQARKSQPGNEGEQPKS